MARIRTIKPEFWSSPAMAGMDPWARLLFVAMWNWADDSGRGTADPKTLAGFAFPKDEDISSADIRRMLGEIRRGFDVVFYEVGGRPYYCIPSWDRHQKIDKRSNPKHPAPIEGVPWNPDPQDPSWTALDQQGPTDDSQFDGHSAGSSEDPPDSRRNLGAGTGEVGSRNLNTRPPAEPADTNTLFGDGHPDSEGIPRQGKAKRPTEAQAMSTPEWQEFWYRAFPRRESRAPAVAAWIKATFDRKVDPKIIIDGAYAYARRMREEDTPPNKVKMAQGWLNDRRWEDKPAPAPGAGPSSNVIPLDDKCQDHPGHRKSTCVVCRDEALASADR